MACLVLSEMGITQLQPNLVNNHLELPLYTVGNIFEKLVIKIFPKKNSESGFHHMPDSEIFFGLTSLRNSR